MPGFFYHFFCLLRSWGLSLESLSTVTPGAIVPAGAMGLSPLSPTLPPMEVDVDATFAAMAMVSEALPEAVGALVLVSVGCGIDPPSVPPTRVDRVDRAALLPLTLTPNLILSQPHSFFHNLNPTISTPQS